MERIAVLTSGGDAPGMNAAIRASVRVALSREAKVWGVSKGYAGLIQGELKPLNSRSVSEIMQRGGTILQTARCEEFKTEDGQRAGVRNLVEHGIEGLVVIGGDGSMHGALAIHRLGFPVVGVPASIDNDLRGTDMSIGVDTALNTILEAIDRVKDTASAHHRAFIVQVMGRHCGYLALMAGMAGGAEVVLIPEVEANPAMVVEELKRAYAKGKPHFIAIVAEGAKYDAAALAQYIEDRKEEAGFETRVTILGHIQRGGSPTAFDRILATRLGAVAVEQLLSGISGKMVGLVGNEIKATDIATVLAEKKKVDKHLYTLAEVLAR
ncbi:MAG: 6-phosphofructokinase [Chloroflexi bacterium]|nr:6-phosphofructokinase [Chloroflexota bacterium]MCL5075076.1 6-phosphofructokinase [Chloroflexota bacterium]